MRKLTLLGALLIAVLACTAALSTPEPAHAIMCCDYGGYQTDHHWHMANNCTDAGTAYRAAALPEAQAYCGGATRVCVFTLPPCYAAVDANNQPTGMWVIDGPATFGCRETCPINP